MTSIVEEMAAAIEGALPESDTLTLAPSQIRRAATAAFAVVEPRLRELEEALTLAGNRLEWHGHRGSANDARAALSATKGVTNDAG